MSVKKKVYPAFHSLFLEFSIHHKNREHRNTVHTNLKGLPFCECDSKTPKFTIS